jgi:branched-chain amino acid transport system ATP-binding protein
MSASDYIIVLDQGRKLAEGTPQHVAENPAVIAAYLGEVEPQVEAEVRDELAESS